MKLFFSEILLAFYLLTTCLSEQKASDQVMLKAEIELAINVVVISPEVIKSLKAKAKDDLVFTKNWVVSVADTDEINRFGNFDLDKGTS